MLIVYFSSVTENTKRFVDKLGFTSYRIPLRKNDPELVVTEPYVLICPTYGGGVSLTKETVKPVPPQVEKFLANPDNAGNLRGVVASGNTNFGLDYGVSGNIVSQKFNVPHLYTFELMGSVDDVKNLRNILHTQATSLGIAPPSDSEIQRLETRDKKTLNESADRLQRLRNKYDHKENK